MTSTGFVTDNMMEVINIHDPKNVCKNLPNLPASLDKSAMVVSSDDSPLLCGLYDPV